MRLAYMGWLALTLLYIQHAVADNILLFSIGAISEQTK